MDERGELGLLVYAWQSSSEYIAGSNLLPEWYLFGVDRCLGSVDSSLGSGRSISKGWVMISCYPSAFQPL